MPGNQPPTSQSSRSTRRTLVLVAGLVVVSLSVCLLEARILAWYGRQAATRDLGTGSIAAAQAWLNWSHAMNPEDGATWVLKATCFRHQKRSEDWADALQHARDLGASASSLQFESELGSTQWGDMRDEAEMRFVALLEAGVSPHDVGTAFVHGYLAREERKKAEVILDAWQADHPDSVQAVYMRGVYWQHCGRLSPAMDQWRAALSREPRHELARAALASAFEVQDQLEQAFHETAELVDRAPSSKTARIDLARRLRKLGRLEDARKVLEAIVEQNEPVASAWAEMAHLELECGRYDEACRWFSELDVEQVDDSMAATALALDGRTRQAERVFVSRNARQNAATLMQDLETRLLLAPDDRQAASQLLSLSEHPPGHTTQDSANSMRMDESQTNGHWSDSGRELYAHYCAACHGANGDGQGRASKHLHPKPRNLRSDSFRLVSAESRVPSRADMERVIQFGMPGTSMRSFEELSPKQRTALVDEVTRLRREGLEESYRELLRDQGEPVEEEEVRYYATMRSTPGDAVVSPRIGPADEAGIARGQTLYVQHTCNSCHGGDGLGVSDLTLLDDEGRTTRPRDLVHEPFRRGDDAESIYMVLRLGMPGTPHPATPNLADRELVDLVHYCQSLMKEPKRILTNHEQAIYANGRAYLVALDGSASAESSPTDD